jgi:hypothetical protein
MFLSHNYFHTIGVFLPSVLKYIYLHIYTQNTQQSNATSIVKTGTNEKSKSEKVTKNQKIFSINQTEGIILEQTCVCHGLLL